MAKDPFAGNKFRQFKQRVSSGEELKAEVATQWEHARVAYLLKEFGLSRHKGKLSRRQEHFTGVGALAFDGFELLFPTFPMRLGASKLDSISNDLHLSQKATLPNWFKVFRHLPFVKFYEDLVDRLGADAESKPVGLVFPRVGFKQGMVVHNGPMDRFVPPKTSCMVYHDEEFNLIVQPFSVLVKAVKAERWNGDVPNPDFDQ